MLIAGACITGLGSFMLPTSTPHTTGSKNGNIFSQEVAMTMAAVWLSLIHIQTCNQYKIFGGVRRAEQTVYQCSHSI